MSRKPIVVVGAGFFGLYIAEYLAKRGRDVLVLEKAAQVMQRASFANQARVHNGCHYPRSVLTALRCRVSFPRFVEEFSECIHDDFEQYYLIGRILGKVTAKQFAEFCQRIGVGLEPAPQEIEDLANPQLIEAVFRTDEVAFNAVTLADMMKERVRQAGVEVRTSLAVEAIRESPGGLTVVARRTGEAETEAFEASEVYLCAYSGTNQVLRDSGLESVPLKQEMTELCLVDVPTPLARVGLTVMCGPFFSVMPFPSTQHHSFSHVRYTPHFEWLEPDSPGAASRGEFRPIAPRNSAWKKIRYDARRYIPILDECVYRSSIWETKTLLPRSEVDDSRPILFKANHALPGLHCVLGGKIDNIYDALELIEGLGLTS